MNACLNGQTHGPVHILIGGEWLAAEEDFVQKVGEDGATYICCVSRVRRVPALMVSHLVRLAGGHALHVPHVACLILQATPSGKKPLA